MDLSALEIVGGAPSSLDERVQEEQILSTMRVDLTKSRKRSVRTRSISFKLAAIQRVENGESIASVGRELSVPESTIRGWCKSEEKIREMARKSYKPDSDTDSLAFSSGNKMPYLASTSNVFSDDEAGPSSKRLKLDDSRDLTNKLDHGKPVMIDEINRINNSALLLQHTNLLSSAQNVTTTTNFTNSWLNLSAASGLASSSRQYESSNCSNMRKTDEAIRLWPAERHNVQMTSGNVSWFWQWYKTCVSSEAFGNMQPQAKRSPSKAKVQLDKVLWRNNNSIENEQMPVDLSASATSANSMSKENTTKAIEHGQMFCEWLEKGSDPTVTRLQIMQLKNLLDSLKDKWEVGKLQ